MLGRQESGPLLQVRNVQLGDCHVCRFTPSGRYLVCFSTAQHELLLYSYTGLQFGTHGEPDAEVAEVRCSASAEAACARPVRPDAQQDAKRHARRSLPRECKVTDAVRPASKRAAAGVGDSTRRPLRAAVAAESGGGAARAVQGLLPGAHRLFGAATCSPTNCKLMACRHRMHRRRHA